MAKSIQEEARRRALSFDGWPGPDGQRNLADLLRALADHIDKLEQARGMAGITVTHASTFTTDETQDNEGQR